MICWFYLGYPGGHQLGRSWPLGFPLALFYFMPAWCLVFLSRMVSEEGRNGIQLFLIIAFWSSLYNKQRLKETAVLVLNELSIWAATWQNQQSDCVPSEDSDQSGHPPSLIRVFAVCMKKPWVLSYPLSAQRKLWSDWADAQADLSLR